MYLMRHFGLGSMSQKVRYLNVVNGIDATVYFLKPDPYCVAFLLD